MLHHSNNLKQRILSNWALYLFLLPLKFRLLLLAFLQFNVVKSGFQDKQSALTVVLLASGLSVLDSYAGRDVPYAHTRFNLVDILAAVAAGTEGVPFDVARIDFYVYGIIHQRIDENGAERRLALALRIER